MNSGKISKPMRIAVGCACWLLATVSPADFTTNSVGTGSTGTTTQDSSTVLPPVDGGIDSSSLSGSLSSALSALSFSSIGGVVTATIGSFGSPAPSSVSYTASPGSICTISGSTVTAVGLGTCSISAVVGKDQYYNPGTVTEDFQVTAVSQTPIALGSISWAADGTATVPGVTGGDGTGAVTYTASSGCSVSGTTITASAPGTCSVTATKAASGVFDSASVTETVTITAVSQASLAFDLSGTSFSGTTASLPAPTGGSGSGSVSYFVASGPCTVSGSTLTATGVGTCNVSATKASTGLYSDVSASDTIAFAGQSQDALAVSISGTTVSATGGSGTGSLSYSVSPSSVCTISGTTITTVGTGTCNVSATKGASGTYLSASATSSISLNIQLTYTQCKSIGAGGSCGSGWELAASVSAMQIDACGSAYYGGHSSHAPGVRYLMGDGFRTNNRGSWNTTTSVKNYANNAAVGNTSSNYTNGYTSSTVSGVCVRP